MKHTHVVRLTSAILVAAAFIEVHAQSVDVIPHRIIQGLRFDWPTAVICLKNTNSRAYIRLIRPRLSTYARLSAVPEGNLLIATVPPDRMPVLLKTIVALDLNGADPSEALQSLPSTFKESLERSEPEQPNSNSAFVEDQYVAVHLKPGRLVPYLQMYSDVPIQMLASKGAIFIQGDANRVNEQVKLAFSIDVANYDQCVQANGT